MEVLDPTITTPLSVSKKKAITAHTSAELKKTIENTPVKNDRSWLNTASIEDITQFMKDNWRFGKGIPRMYSPEGIKSGASHFYRSLRSKKVWESIQNDPNLYKQVVWISKKIRKSQSWLNTASIEDITKFMKDNWRFGKGITWMQSPEGVKLGAGAFYDAVKTRPIWESIQNDPNLYKQVFGIKKRQTKEWWWLDSASIDDISKYVKKQWWYWKGARRMTSSKGKLAGAGAFYDSIGWRDIWNAIKNNSKIYKQVFGIDKQIPNDRSWLNSASLDDITQFMKDNWRFGKGISWITQSQEGINSGARAFYSSLITKPIRDIIQADAEIYLKVFGKNKREQKDRSWLNSASIDDISQFIKDNWWFWTSIKWMRWKEWTLAGSAVFLQNLMISPIRSSIKNNSKIYKKVFWINKQIPEDLSWIDSASIDDISQFIKDKWRFGKGVTWSNSIEGRRSKFGSFYSTLIQKPIWESIKNDANLYKKVFGVNKTNDRSRLNSASLDDITQFIKDKWRFGKGVTWMQSPEGKKSNAIAFYWALQKSIHRTSIRDNHVIYKQIFGVDKEIWSRINTASINDINQFMKDNWRFGKGANRMNSPEGKLAGASAFYNAMRWKDIWNSIQNNSKIYKQVFGKLPYKRPFQDKNIEVGFDSLEERRIAIILYKLWMVEKRKEGENLHVKTNDSTKHSIDFKIGDTFLEYHPYNPNRQKHMWWSFIGEAQRKYDHITNPLYKDKLDLIVFDDKIDYYDKKSHTWKHKREICRSLFNIIRETPTLISRIPLEKRYIMLDYTHFKDFYAQVAKELSDYDMQSTSIESQE